MSFSDLLTYLRDNMGTFLPTVLGAVAILLLGILLALIVRAVLRKTLNRIKFDERIKRHSELSFGATAGAAAVGFWFVVIMTLIAVFSFLQFDDLSKPLSSLVATVMVYLPRIVLATILAVVAMLLATAVRAVVNKAMVASGWDEKLSRSAEVRPLSAALGNVLYWFVLLVFLPAIVAALNIEGLMGPLTEMTNIVLSSLPNLFSAVIIALAGWLIARVLRGLITNLLEASGVDKFSDRPGFSSGVRLSQLGGTLAFVLVIVPALIAALQALSITAISDPATEMLRLFLVAVPNILAAAMILVVAWFVGRFIAELLATLLCNMGFDRLPPALGLLSSPEGNHDEPDAAGAMTASKLAGHVALFFTMLFAAVEASNRLGFDGVGELLQRFIGFGADILLGVFIFVVGLWLANIAAKAIQRSNQQNALTMSRIARFGILGLVVAMGLRAMGIADEIVNLAFGLILGSLAVAVALAFGLGGGKAAGRVAQHWADGYLGKKADSDADK